MTEGIIAQHPPALKVGGRRLSISTKHKSHPSTDTTSPEVEKKHDEAIPDYPRPAPPTGDAPLHHIHHHHEEDMPPKREKKHDNERKMQEYAHWKSETTRPTRDLNAGGKGQFMRIAQPAGKALGV